MKINKMKSQAIKEMIARMKTMISGNYTKDQDKKNWTELPKGRETGSQYYKHLKEELGRRTR